MKNKKWGLMIMLATMVAFASCGNGDTKHLNDNPNDMGMPDSSTYSDSPMPGQPNGYAPAGSNNKDSTDETAVDSSTMGAFQ